MNKVKTTIKAIELRLSLKHTVRHASKERKKAESIWVKVSRNGISGFGEGCPRDYVAGDDLASSIKWVEETFSDGDFSIGSIDELRRWVDDNKAVIDKFPSAWCAVEMGFLDLLAREKNVNIETLLGISGPRLKSRYCAVLADSSSWMYASQIDRFLIRGIKDFKIKLNGDPEKDRKKLDAVKLLAVEHGVPDVRIRFDANNLWKDRTDDAISHIKALGSGVFAVEEPVKAKDPEANSRFSLATALPVILDESLCTFEDFKEYLSFPGDYIANIKISRVGGILRAMKLIDAFKEAGWKIIIGCHVGETSLLTRAGLVVAACAGESLIAHEGAYGDYLIEREPADPMLKFGRKGILDLNMPYYMKTVFGLRMVPAENWKTGFGMTCRMPEEPDTGDPEISVLTMPDNYDIHYRLWGSPKGEDVVVILHGGMSHSGWQAPLATSLLSKRKGLSVVAPDRRGCGLNANRGDLGNVDLVISDVVNHVTFLKKSFKRVHLAGWCQGSQYASIAAAGLGETLTSLILLTPGFFWNERFRSVLRTTELVGYGLLSSFKIKPKREDATAPIPMEGSDFTTVDKWLDFIETDKLKTTKLNLKSTAIMDEIQELSWTAIFQNQLPLLAVLAENDRIVDNNKVEQVIGHMFEDSMVNRLFKLDTGHAIQFEKPEEVAGIITDFIQRDKN